MAPCSQTLQNLSGIHHGAPAGTLHPLCQCRHRSFMSLCLVWIFVYSKVPVLPPDPLSGCNLNLISLPTIQHRRLSLGLFFLTQALLLPLPCLAWPGLARRRTYTFTLQRRLHEAEHRSVTCHCVRALWNACFRVTHISVLWTNLKKVSINIRIYTKNVLIGTYMMMLVTWEMTTHKL